MDSLSRSQFRTIQFLARRGVSWHPTIGELRQRAALKFLNAGLEYQVTHLLLWALVLLKSLTATAATGADGVRRDRGPPDDAAARAITYEDLLGIADLGIGESSGSDAVSLSPDGRSVALEVRRANLALNKTEIRWLVVPLDRKEAPVDVGGGGEPIAAVFNGLINGFSIPQIAQWSPDSEWIAYTVLRDGEVQLWRSTRDGRVQEQLTRNGGDITSFHWSPGGRKILFTVGATRAETDSAVEAEADRGFHYDERFAPVASLRPLGSWSKAAIAARVWTYDVMRRSEQPASEEERAEYLSPLWPSPVEHPERKSWRKAANSEAEIWLEDRRPNPEIGIRQPLTVMGIPPGGSHPIECSSSTCKGYFRGLWMTGDGLAAYFLRWVGAHDYGTLALYEWKINGSAPREIIKTDDLIGGCALERGSLICGLESATRPKRLVKVSLRNGRIETLFDPNPQFQRLKFGTVVPITWSDQHGVEGFGHLVKPIGYTSGRRYPLVIVQYRSRGFLRGGVGDEYPIHVLAAKGFAVLSFHRPDDWEVEATSSSEDEVTRKRYKDFHDLRRVLSVLLAGMDTLEQMGVIDGRRVGITGLSDGGETAGFALIHAPDRFAAAAVSWTWWNPILFDLVGPKFQPTFRSMGIEEPGTHAGDVMWQGLSVALNAKKIQAAVLLQVADSEMLPETQTVTALRDLGKPIEMYVFPSEAHIKAQPRHRYNIYKRSTQWFEFWLENRQEPDPVDTDEYKEWTALRNSAGRNTEKVYDN